jgi:hypothetical protein
VDRRFTYIGAIPQDIDILLTNKNAMISDGWVAQSIVGTSTLFSGLACTPTSPTTLTVNVAPGCVFSQQNVDNSAYGSLSPDTTDQIVKIGIALSVQNFSCPAPSTVGYSVVYLIEAAFVETDTGAAVLPYYNAANPSMPWAGPNNTGASQNTIRQNECSVQLKAGVPATTGTQTTPAPDAGYTGLWAITVAYGQTTITSGNIAQIGGAPFISETLTQKLSQASADLRYAQITNVQNAAHIFANDTSVTQGIITAALNPAPTAYVKGMTVIINVANANAGISVINLNGLGYKGITTAGNALKGGEFIPGQNYIMSYDGTSFEINSSYGSGQRALLTANTSFYVSTTGNDSTGNGTVAAPYATIQKAWNVISENYDLNGYAATIQLEDGTYTPTVGLNAYLTPPGAPGGGITINGNSTTPSNVLIAPTSGICFQGQEGAVFTIQNLKMQSSVGAALVSASNGALIFLGSGLIFGLTTGPHLVAEEGGFILGGAGYTIAAGASAHAQAFGGGIIYIVGFTITLASTPAFTTAFALATLNASLDLSLNTFSGSATGVRYILASNSVLNTNGAGTSYLPGNASGTTATGAQYV